jgi:Tol biopolymer transport system component
MSDPSREPEPDRPAPEDRLDSWKEIAAYLKRDVTTVQRWEKREAMPVRRHLHEKLGSVYAFRSELDAWARSRRPTGTDDTAQTGPTPDRSNQWDAVVDTETEAVESLTAVAPSPHVRPRRTIGPWVVATGGLVLALAVGWWLSARSASVWRDSLSDAQFRTITDFDGSEQAAAVSRDGRFVAFLSDRDGRMDVWVTQIGAGQFYNLTRGRVRELVNPSVRTLGFSPDGALVTFWARGGEGSESGDINIWAVPTLGGEPRPYLEGAAEFDWSKDGSRLVYHTPGPGDPMFVKDSSDAKIERALFTAAAGLHAHFPLWSPDNAFIYFVQGSTPDAMDIWRIRPSGGKPEQLTHHNGRVSHPVWLDDRTLMYLASEMDGSGPWLHGLDVEHPAPHRLGSGLDRYTSLSASADGRRVVATLANLKGTFWRMPIANAVAASAPTPVSLSTGRGFSPRLGRSYLLYASADGARQGIWKVADGSTTELWGTTDARIIGGPEIGPDEKRVAFSVEQRGKTLLYTINADGTNARVVTDALDLRGNPAWTPDGQTITSAVNVDGKPQLFQIALDGKATPFVQEYSVDPVWSLEGDLVLYSGPDVGATFQVKAVSGAATPHPIPNLTLTRGARRLRFLPGRRQLVAMRGEIQHKDLWLIDLETGQQRQLTELPSDFTIRDFDVSPDGRDIVLERVQEHADVVLIEVPSRD